MRLADLADAALGLDVRAFAERNPEPALVFFPSSSKPEPTPFDTLAGREHRFDGAATDELPALETTIEDPRAKRPTDRIALPRYVKGKGPEGPEWSVHFLAKSHRNPFSGMITIGRASNNDIQLLVSSVSKFHASFAFLAGAWTIADQNATNGTFVD
ncbi:MAG TPA: FHA domain-containing protein, partial [Planctomycetota bacterium]|nr:FHA domain-containing protein [Planctomycetota bacterium]